MTAVIELAAFGGILTVGYLATVHTYWRGRF